MLKAVLLYKLPQQVNKSQQCSTFVDQQELNDVELCIIRLKPWLPAVSRKGLF